MPPIVDEKSKENLIMCKNIRQATCKILQRPSYFQGSNTTNNQEKQKSEEISNIKSRSSILLKDSTIEKNFEFILRSNVSSGEKCSDFDYEFEKLHKNQHISNNLYEEIEEARPYQPKRW